MNHVFTERLKEIDNKSKHWKKQFDAATTIGFKQYCKGQVDGQKEARDVVERLIGSYEIYHGEENENESQSNECEFIPFSRINTTV